MTFTDLDALLARPDIGSATFSISHGKAYVSVTVDPGNGKFVTVAEHCTASADGLRAVMQKIESAPVEKKLVQIIVIEDDILGDLL